MSVLTKITRVKNNSLQAELVDTIEKPGRMNVLAKLNKGDERFKVGSQRRAWFPVTILSLREIGVNPLILLQIEALKETEFLELNMESPKVEGDELRIQVVESTIPDAYQKANAVKSAKQIMISEEIASNSNIKTDYNLRNYVGKNGFFVDKNDAFIFAKATVTVGSQVEHKFIEATLVPETELAEFGAVLATSDALKGQEA